MSSLEEKNNETFPKNFSIILCLYVIGVMLSNNKQVSENLIGHGLGLHLLAQYGGKTSYFICFVCFCKGVNKRIF